MSKLQEELAAGRFVATAEIAPPKGVELKPLLATAAAFSGVTAVNVTDNQGANMRMAPLAVAGKLAEAGIEPVLQLTCRDRNRLALQSDLLGASALGVENCCRVIMPGLVTTPKPGRFLILIRFNCCKLFITFSRGVTWSAKS